MSFKHGILFLLMAGAALAAAGAANGLAGRLGLSLTALSFLIVAIAYCFGWPCLLMKRSDGARPWWAWIALWPYFGLVWVSFWLIRLLHRHGASTEVEPGVWLSRRLSAREIRGIRSSGVGLLAVLDLAAELPRGAPRELTYLSLPLLDGTAPSIEAMNRAVQWIDEQHARGPVLVHCAAGHGRSATVVLAWLLSCGYAADVETGLARLRELRPGIAVNRSQLARVREVTNG